MQCEENGLHWSNQHLKRRKQRQELERKKMREKRKKEKRLALRRRLIKAISSRDKRRKWTFMAMERKWGREGEKELTGKLNADGDK